MPRMKLITEGEVSNTAYIIREGTCSLVCSKNPILNKLSPRGRLINEEGKMTTKKGYISQTTSTYPLGYINEGEWIGEEILELGDLPFSFSVIAKTEVKALAISKQELQTKIPSDFRKILEERAHDRNRWMHKRMREIFKTSHIIYKQDRKQGVYDKVLNQLFSQHPQATSNALKSFTSHHVNITGMENTGRIIRKVATNHRKSDSATVVNASKYGLNVGKLHNHSRGESEYYRTKPAVVNKAVFLEGPMQTKRINHNMSMDAANTSDYARGATAPYANTYGNRETIEMSFNKMRLTKKEEAQQNSKLFHKRQFEGK